MFKNPLAVLSLFNLGRNAFVILIKTILFLTLVGTSNVALAFCGFYVAKADTDLFNSASQVVMVRDNDRTVITMANDFRGDVADFAMVVPVPAFIEREQINVATQGLIDHLDAYTAPRLVEYFDENPCRKHRYRAELASTMMTDSVQSKAMPEATEEFGVTIEAKYTVGEYDILILSAEQSGGLIDWLHDNNYQLPQGAEEVVGSYLRQGMRFFVARVNIEAQQESGYANLRSLQIAFESPKFMLPIRLGTLNADGQQELFVYALTRSGRVETSNYRTVRMPSNVEIPGFVKGRFDDFYRDMFTRQTEKENGKAVFLEYAWDMAWCDPCAADPLTTAQLRNLGVYWLQEDKINVGRNNKLFMQRPQDVFVTRLHLRYDSETFPDDLKFIETGDRSNYQGRYVMRHAWTGEANCFAATDYFKRVNDRNIVAGNQLANLTGWDRQEIADLSGMMELPEEKWWQRIWQTQ